MAAQPPTQSGKLSELARHVILPSGIASTGWPSVRDKCRDLGVDFDLWQDGLGRAILAKRADGKYATTVGGVFISIPRQVGKTFILGAIVFALCLLHPGLTVIWTAHRLRTANETFASMLGFSRRKKIAPHMLRPSLGSGEQEIRFRNGSRILFGARERGFGRGFSEVDVIVFDEAQILTDNAIDDMVPAANQSKQAAGALVLYTGTPPKPTDPGEVFSRARKDALAGESEDALYVEFSADQDADPNDRKQWAKANPSYPKRTPLESMQRMKKNLSPESFVREALGIWDDDDTGWLTISHADWIDAHREARSLSEFGQPALAIAASLDLSSSSIAASVVHDGELWVKVLAHGPGTAWLAETAKQIQGKHSISFVVDKGGPVSSLIDPLEEAGVMLEVVGAAELCNAAAGICTAATEKRLRHMGNPELDTAVRGSIWRNVGDRRALGRKTGDIAPYEAASLAAWAAERQANYDVLDSIL